MGEYRTYRFTMGRSECSYDNLPDVLAFGNMGGRVSIDKQRITGVAVCEIPFWDAPGAQLTEIVDASLFPTLDRPMDLFVAYTPPGESRATFVLGTLLPSHPECQALIEDLKRELSDRFLGIGPAPLVAEKLGVADEFRRKEIEHRRGAFIGVATVMLMLVVAALVFYTQHR